MRPKIIVDGDHKACCESLYEALENLAGDIFLLGLAEIKLDDICEGSHHDALKLLKRLQQYRSDDLRHEAIAATKESEIVMSGNPQPTGEPPQFRIENWPVNDVLLRLADAVEHLLQDHNCDMHGYEGLTHAVFAARQYGERLEWQWTHDRNADLIRRDGLMCEQHPGLEFDHDPLCSGPGVAWVIEGKQAVKSIFETRSKH